MSQLEISIPQSKRIGVVIVCGAVAIVALALGLYLRARSRINHVALSSLPKPVTVVAAKSASYRPVHTYIASLDPWVVAKVGPQYVSAYVATVLVRPGDVLKEGQVLATLDCRNSAAASNAVAASAKSMSQRQVALSHQVTRMKQMLSGGFASANEVEQMNARSSSEAAELESLKASLSVKTLEVDDCIQRAPFDSEVAERLVDPGAYVRPSSSIVTVLDRRTIRVASSAPEQDFNILSPGTLVDIDIPAIHRKLSAAISRRAPGADATTRTVDFEIDVPNEKRELPANATATLTIPVGKPQPSTRIPSLAATLRGQKATLFVVKDGVASHKTVGVLGEAEGQLYLSPTDLPPGTQVVTEGRALLEEGDHVSAQEVTP
jgi:RND family efflux transporter MFP subunit